MPRRRSGPEILAAAGDLVVQRDGGRPSGRLLRHGDMDASYVDLADPRHLEFDYLRRMRDVAEALGARRVVHVGGGACALARALAASAGWRGGGGGGGGRPWGGGAGRAGGGGGGGRRGGAAGVLQGRRAGPGLRPRAPGGAARPGAARAPGPRPRLRGNPP